VEKRAATPEEPEGSLEGEQVSRVVALSGQTIEFRCPLAAELASLIGAAGTSGERFSIIWRKGELSRRLAAQRSTPSAWAFRCAGSGSSAISGRLFAFRAELPRKSSLKE